MMQLTRTIAVADMSLLRRISLTSGLFAALAPNSLSATSDARNTNDVRTAKPSADASSQFLSAGDLIVLKKFTRSYSGLMVLLSRNRAALSSNTWNKSRESACIESEDQEQVDAMYRQQ